MTLIEKTAFMKTVDVLARIPTEALAQVAARAQEQYVDPGEVLFREGEPNRGAFLVVDGMIELRRGSALVRMLRERMAFGELFLDQDEPHLYTGVATQASHVLNIQTQDIMEALLDFPEFGMAMTRSLALRVHVLTQRVLELEELVNRFHAALRKAGIEPPDPVDPHAVPAARAGVSDLAG